MTQLLLGAGFSRNWGGWLASEVFDYLLGTPEVLHDTRLRALLWQHRATGGFEAALAELQVETERNDADDQKRAALTQLLNAVGRMFKDMNVGLQERPFEFTQDGGMQVGPFLGRFAAIFTLNQDLLLEQHYVHNMHANGHRRFHSVALPGMQRRPSTDPMQQDSWAASTWTPGGPIVAVDDHTQPIYKLHGSSNWLNAGGQMMVVGGDKVAQIGSNEVLHTYAGLFGGLLRKDNNLMIIGYGFRDEHINSLLFDAAENGLQIFLIHPSGSDLAAQVDAARGCNSDGGPQPLQELFERSLVGVSRRPLDKTFATDTAERDKVMRFIA